MTQTTNQDFYWQTARDSLLTPAALNMFQIALQFEGQDFEQSKHEIDRRYETAMGRDPSQRHGGNFQTFIRVFEEAGWMTLEVTENGTLIRTTPAGKQAAQLLINLPDTLKAVPYFIIELLSRYQLNNPSGPYSTRNRAISEATAQSNIFPYWTVWKIMRSCDNRITTDELRRFVFRIQQSDQVDDTIAIIKSYRQDVAQGLTSEQLNDKYPLPLEGAVREAKYIMGRAGRHVGQQLQLITKPNATTYVLNPAYNKLIDNVINNEPVFKDYIDNDTWFNDYGQPVLLDEELVPFSISVEDPEAKIEYPEVNDDDEIWKQVKSLIDLEVRNFLFVGPPGTSKTTYALRIGAKLAEYRPDRFHNIQFHQSFSYEDFMEGYIPSDDTTRSTPFVLKDKVFLRACARARRDSSTTLHVIVIDEFNRGDPSRIFGEALTYIERRGEAFELPYSRKRVFIPKNLVILARMNPLDKSITDLDMALDRRFEKIEMAPNREILRSIITENGMSSALAGRVVAFFDRLTDQIKDRIGHAYFKDAKDLTSLRQVWNHRVLPLVKKELIYEPNKLQNIIDDFETSFRP